MAGLRLGSIGGIVAGGSSGKRYGGGRSGGRIHSPALDGRRVAPTVASTSRVSVARSTSCWSRSPYAARLRSASSRGRSKRRSTSAWTRDRTGWNAAKASSVDAATASVCALRDRPTAPPGARGRRRRTSPTTAAVARPQPERAAHEPVDLVQPVPQHGDHDRDRDGRVGQRHDPGCEQGHVQPQHVGHECPREAADGDEREGRREPPVLEPLLARSTAGTARPATARQ